MKNKTIKNFITLALGSVALLGLQPASAGWIDWTSTTEGTIDISGTTVGVTLTGIAHSLENGDYYYNNASTGGTSPTGTYLGLAPTDMIRVDAPSTFTLSFDKTVTDLTMALVSVGRTSLGVTYDFDSSFTASDAGGNIWGTGSYATGPGDTFTGYEYNGILNFKGMFDSITFSTDPSEYWHGFNFASYSAAMDVPEPATAALFSLGLLSLLVSRRRKHHC